ncbi:MAG: hypothetical protein IJO19_02330, partial [Clostridia bacterium]|nr:hypothetical protein [Clostridia bacterium]
TGNGLRKSIHSQENFYGGNLGDFAKVVLNMQKLLDNSVLIDVHSDKGKGTKKEHNRLQRTFVLISAMQEGNTITPVQFEIMQYIDNNNRLYLAVALSKTEKTGVMGNTAHKNVRTYLLPVSNISITDLFKKINPKDRNLKSHIRTIIIFQLKLFQKRKEVLTL